MDDNFERIKDLGWLEVNLITCTYVCVSLLLLILLFEQIGLWTRTSLLEKKRIFDIKRTMFTKLFGVKAPITTYHY